MISHHRGVEPDLSCLGSSFGYLLSQRFFTVEPSPGPQDMWCDHVDGMLRVPEVTPCLASWVSQVQLIEASHVKTTCSSDLPKMFRYFVFSDF